MTTALLAIAVAAPLVAALAALLSPGIAAASRVLTAGTAIATTAAAILIGLNIGDDTDEVATISWLDMTLGRAGALLLLLIAGTATVVAGFSARNLDDDGRAPRYFALIGVVATGSALVVVPAAPLALLIGWLASGWALVALVGFQGRPAITAPVQRRIGITLAIGDLALLAAIIVAAHASDGLLTGRAGAALVELRNTSIGGVAAVHIVAMLVVVAGASRSALVPFHRWLLGTLVAPTPVSALVHAGLVSGAGLLLLRFAPPFVDSDAAVITAFTLGVITVLIASSASLLRTDAKGSLAWSTVAQMAFMVIQCAVGAFSSAIFHIAGHGMYKASLFLGVGDTAAAGLRSRRRAVPEPLASPLVRTLTAVAAATIAVGVAVWAIPPDVADSGRLLVVVFAWISIAFGVAGWMARGPMAPIPAIAAGTAVAFVSAFAYIGGLRIVEEYLKPSLGSEPIDTVISSAALLSVLAAIGIAIAFLTLLPGSTGAALRRTWHRIVLATTETGLSRPAPARPVSPIAMPDDDPVRRAEIRADVANAAAIVAPQWPLASFVAVNPLGGLESLGFEDATDMARRWLGARTHLSLADFRDDHARGLTRPTDLQHVVAQHLPGASERSPLPSGAHATVADIVIADLLHGPELAPAQRPGTRLQRTEGGDVTTVDLIDDTLASWVAAYLDAPHWKIAQRGERFAAMSLRQLTTDPRFASVLDASSTEWIRTLDRDPAAMIDAALSVSGVADRDRIDEIRAHFCRLPGWSGIAKWRNEWAQPDEDLPPLAPIDVVAVRTVLEAVVLRHHKGDVTSTRPSSADEMTPRVDAVIGALSIPGDDLDRGAIAEVLAEVPAGRRVTMWLEAQEHHVDERLLSLMSQPPVAETGDRPDVQMVFCIDVRSEGFRRHIESLGAVDTIGFAGFFGVPMRIQRLGWGHSEARCPVLVAPAIAAIEHPRREAISVVSKGLAQERAVGGVHAAHTSAKYGLGAPFTLAETMGWVLGPRAALRTFVPSRSMPTPAPDTRMALDDDEVLVEQRTFFAEAVLNTMGLTTGFAPLVVLCGHTSRTTNNPHATALECGACAGASGDDNARAVAALLNSPDVRHGLAERGIDIPDDTRFIGGLHDTASDRVTLLDTADALPEHGDGLRKLVQILETAGGRQAADRAPHLRGRADRVRERGADWAQVRPEWGLARNAAFIVGPRSITAGLDLEGRAFLHTYDADADPTGRVLETIMTAPLVVGHWISSQYYFSTVDPEVFGAGDKLLHNPIGTTGVISGDRGDLRVGLPLQSTHADGRRFHQPVRLLAVIQADLERIDDIIASHPVLQTLTKGSWLRLSARSHPGEPWSSRTADGFWVPSPQPTDPHAVLTPSLETT